MLLIRHLLKKILTMKKTCTEKDMTVSVNCRTCLRLFYVLIIRALSILLIHLLYHHY